MKRGAIILLTLFAVTATAKNDEKEKAIKQEKEKLQGKWKVDGHEINGKEQPPPADVFVVIDGDKWTIEAPQPKDAKASGRGGFTFQIDPTQSPKTLDLTLKRNEKRKGSGIVEKCIYKLDADTLTVCSNQSGTYDPSRERPKEFKAEGSNSIRIYKRVKK